MLVRISPLYNWPYIWSYFDCLYLKHLSKKSVVMGCTLYFRKEKLSTNSSRDFSSVLDTIDHYWIDPAKYFCPNSSSTSAIYDNFKSKVLKVVESKKGHHFYDFQFETIIDGTQGGTFRAKIFSWVNSVLTYGVWNTIEVSWGLNWPFFVFKMKSV